MISKWILPVIFFTAALLATAFETNPIIEKLLSVAEGLGWFMLAFTAIILFVPSKRLGFKPATDSEWILLTRITIMLVSYAIVMPVVATILQLMVTALLFEKKKNYLEGKKHEL